MFSFQIIPSKVILFYCYKTTDIMQIRFNAFILNPHFPHSKKFMLSHTVAGCFTIMLSGKRKVSHAPSIDSWIPNCLFLSAKKIEELWIEMLKLSILNLNQEYANWKSNEISLMKETTTDIPKKHRKYVMRVKIILSHTTRIL